MRSKHIKRFETPEGQRQITDYFKASSSARRNIHFGDSSRMKITRKNTELNSDDDFELPTKLPHPFTDDEDGISDTPKRKKIIKKHRQSTTANLWKGQTPTTGINASSTLIQLNKPSTSRVTGAGMSVASSPSRTTGAGISVASSPSRATGVGLSVASPSRATGAGMSVASSPSRATGAGMSVASPSRATEAGLSVASPSTSSNKRFRVLSDELITPSTKTKMESISKTPIEKKIIPDTSKETQKHDDPHTSKNIRVPEDIGTPKKSYKNTFGETEATDLKTPEKRLKLEVALEEGMNLDMNIKVGSSHIKILSVERSDGKCFYESISTCSKCCASPEKNTPTTSCSCKSQSPKKITSIKNTPGVSRPADHNQTKIGCPKTLNTTASTSENNVKPEEEDFKLNVKHMELLKKLFEDTLGDRNKRALLNTNDIKVIEGFLAMDEDNQYFLMKLFLYQLKWYNMQKFCTAIKLDQKLSPQKINKMYENHKTQDLFVDTDLTSLSTYELLNMLLIQDLKKIQKNFKLFDRKTKQEIIQNLIKNSGTQATITMKKSSTDILRDAAYRSLGFCVKLKEDVKSSFYKAYVLQTYANSSYYMDIQAYLTDMCYLRVQYPSYSKENFEPFDSQEKFTRFFEAIQMRNELDVASENKYMVTVKNICNQAFEKLKNMNDYDKWKRYHPVYLHRFSAEYQYIAILKSNMKKLTKNHEDVEKWLEYLILNYPTNNAIGFWMKHMAHITTQYYKNKYDLAAEIVINAYEFNKENKIFDDLQIFELIKLADKLRKTKSYKVSTLNCNKLSAFFELPISSEHFPKSYIKGCTLRSGNRGKRTYSYTDSNHEVTYGSVENITLIHYSDKKNYKGIHCEGRLFSIIFALLFWDLIYEYYVPMTFISKLQHAPLDMYCNSFYTNRKEEIEKRLKEIAGDWPEERFENIFKHNWNLHSHEKSIVDFENLEKSIDEIMIMIRCIDRVVLSKIMRRLVTNYKRFKSGLPDLFLWNPEEKKCKLVEVKGENDTLQQNQILWIQYLIEIGADVEVCHVTGVGAKGNN